MPLHYQKFIRRSDLRANPHAWYVFGDNLACQGMGGQAREMRGEPNAFGIPTKRSPAEYLSDSPADYVETVSAWTPEFTYLTQFLLAGGTVVWPADGIGTGLADLQNRAPRLWQRLELFRAGLELDANHN